jgi:hypothetical protein
MGNFLPKLLCNCEDIAAKAVQKLIEECMHFQMECNIRRSLMAEPRSVGDLRIIGRDLETRFIQVLSQHGMTQELRLRAFASLNINLRRELADMDLALLQTGPSTESEEGTNDDEESQCDNVDSDSCHENEQTLCVTGLLGST